MAKKQTSKTKVDGSLLQKRLKRAVKMAKSKSQIVTLRIPEEFNEWLNRYRHLSYPKRITKQDLLVEGLIYVYLKRGGANEEAIGTKEILGAPLSEVQE